ncbi:MAG: carboxypeptidase-like regulatory domain-containing protein [Acidobacteriota bacterium]
MSDHTTLRIPVDASALDGIDDAHRRLRVVARDALGTLRTTDVTLDADGRAEAEIDVPNDLGDVEISIGPGEFGAADLHNLRQPGTRIRFDEIREQPELRVPDFTIRPELWQRWRRWCRTFVVEGQVTCPNGQPVPGATVTAFDVDFWWWWTSWQKVGTATTDAQGRYRIEFRWCCGFAPWWWWWRRRHWALDPVLADGLVGALQEVPTLPRPTPQPDPFLFAPLADVDNLSRLEPLFDRKRISEPVVLGNDELDEHIARVRLEPPPQLSLQPLEDLRRQLARKLPEPPIAQRLSLWPWYPWQPWFDCAPDLTFQVHAPCPEPETLVLNETIFDLRPNVSTNETIDLVVEDEGCCLAPTDPQPAGQCVVLSNVCSVDIESIGGNETPPVATAAQAGYARFSPPPATLAYPPTNDNIDRPFAEAIRISGTFGTQANLDVYAFEFRPHGAGAWSPLPGGAARGFSRRFYGPALGAPAGTTPDYHWAPFPVQTIDGIEVYSTREHFEDTHEPGTWGLGNPRLWLAANYFLLLNAQTKGYFADSAYDFRLIGWDLDADGHLENRRVLPLCGTQQANEVVIRIDNRYVGGASGHPNVPDHPCGEGTVHVCTLEPDTDVIQVRVAGQIVKPCDILDLDGPMEIDFLAHDPDGHLAWYSLHATYDENKTINLLSLISGPEASLTSLDTPARPLGPHYHDALTQGATAPTWTGGRYRLTLPTPRNVFPKTCGYQLELKAWKRPIVNCSGNYTYRNQSHFTVTIKI